MKNHSSSPLLTIAIPTFNRHKYLIELLPQLISQAEEAPPGMVEILIIDNASTDETPIFLKSINKAFVRCLRNSINIGADRNFIECIQSAGGKYVWLFGDDEVLNPEGIHRVLKHLHEAPQIIIAESSLQNTMRFESYRDLLANLCNIDPIFPVHQTLITRNIFLKEIFDLKYAREMVHTNYSHIYGIITLLKEACSIIILSKTDSAFYVRDVRAEFASPPKNLEKKLIDLIGRISKEIAYPKLATDIWLYYNARPLYRLRRSKKFKKFISFF